MRRKHVFSVNNKELLVPTIIIIIFNILVIIGVSMSRTLIFQQIGRQQKGKTNLDLLQI